MKSIAVWVALSVCVTAATVAQARNHVVDGWTFAVPSYPTESGKRAIVQLSKAGPGVTVTYVMFAHDGGGNVSIKFDATEKCGGRAFGAELISSDVSGRHERAVRRTTHKAFAQFRAKCGAMLGVENALMTGFGNALLDARLLETEADDAGQNVIDVTARNTM